MALPTSPPATAPITAPPIGLNPAVCAIKPAGDASGYGAHSGAGALAGAWRAAAGNQAACSEDKHQGQNRGSRCRHGHTPRRYGGDSLENAAAVAPRFIRRLLVLRRRIGIGTRSAVGQGREPEIDILHEADIALVDRLAADLRALLLDEFRKLIAIGRAEPLDAGKLDGLALDLEASPCR